MDRSEDIEFLEQFRTLAEELLNTPRDDNSDSRRRQLKRQLTIMKPRAEQLFLEFGLENRGIMEYPPPNAAGLLPVIDYPVLSLITNDSLLSSYYSPADVIGAKIQDLALGTIDECIGHLKIPSTEAEPASGKRSQTARPTGTGEGFVFIAMPMTIDDSQLEDILEDIHEAIKDTAREAGLKGERIDDQISNEKITDRIGEAIEDADYVVADLSQAKPNGYWEAGLAHGLGKTPIYIAHKGTELEFDAKDYPVIFYRNAKSLKRDLAERLQGLKAQREHN